MKKLYVLILSLAVTLLLPPSSRGQELNVAAAADLRFAFDEISAVYQKTHTAVVRITYGSSGNFYAQIKNGAPFDVFFSADAEYAKRLESEGLGEAGSFHPYARGHLVLWVPKDSSLDIAHLGLKALLDPHVEKIAIANPEFAPYGRAAVAALKGAALYGQVEKKLVLGESVSQAAQFVESGGAQVGIIALSLASAPAFQSKGVYWELPLDSYPPLVQAVVILKASPRKKDAESFLEFVRSPQGAEILQRYGFSAPEESGR